MRMNKFCFLLALGLTAAGANAQRLPQNVKPTHYNLELAPNISSASFTGKETIDVVLAQPSRTVTLNALELKIDSVMAGTQRAEVTFDVDKQQATFTFAHSLPAGANSLAIVFSGTLNDKLRGFYLSKTKTRNYAVTQFEATDARRAFPSFDEPAFKATFDVALTVDKRDTAISNTNIVSDRPAQNGSHTLTFATTPKMSTYLVAFLVGDFQCTKGKSDGVPIRVCSTPDKVKLTKFALQASEHFLKYYDGYFGIKYPMPKLDLIAIPDFEAGAMENFGAITYRETDLLVDSKSASIESKKRVASVVAHEMAHQWFGDMVTMQWWNNIWLNEGFATWMADKAANDWHPEWNYPQDFANSLDRTLNYDSGRTTRTIRAEANSPAEISEMFDGISYGKAGAVIGMVENWVGPQVFERGVHNYLAAHLYGNATAEDFWGAQTSTSHQPVDEVMRSFVAKPGVPLLTFSNREAAGFPVKQRRFFLSGADDDQMAANAVAPGWTIPVCLKTAAGPKCELISRNTVALEVPAGAQLPFFYANADDKGYYRVGYTPAQVQAITSAVETGLTVPERIGFLGDRWAQTRAGEAKVGEYLDLALAVRKDPNANVLDSTLASMAAIENRVADDEDRKQLNAMVLKEYGPVYAGLGKPGKHDSLDRQGIRTELFGALGEAGDPAVLAHSQQLADSLFSGKKTAEPDLIDTAVALAAAHGDEQFYDRLQVVSENATDPSLKSEARVLLTRFRTPLLVVKTLEYATSGKVRNQDSWVLIARELSQRETQDLAWAWIGKNWDKVSAQLTTASGARIVSATGAFCTVQKRDEVARFFATHAVDASARSLTQALDNVDACVKFRAAQEPNLKQWLAQHPQ